MLKFKTCLVLCALCVYNIEGLKVNVVVEVNFPEETCVPQHTDASSSDKNGAVDIKTTSSTTEFTPTVKITTLALEQMYKKEGYEFTAKTGGWYKFHFYAAKWTNSNSTCIAEGAHLAVVNSVEEKDVLLEMFFNYMGKVQNTGYQNSMAIGVYREGSDNWMTVDGQTLQEAGFAEWDWRQPGTDYLSPYLTTPSILKYGYLDVTRGKLTNEDGQSFHAFVCEK